MLPGNHEPTAEFVTWAIRELGLSASQVLYTPGHSYVLDEDISSGKACGKDHICRLRSMPAQSHCWSADDVCMIVLISRLVPRLLAVLCTCPVDRVLCIGQRIQATGIYAAKRPSRRSTSTRTLRPWLQLSCNQPCLMVPAALPSTYRHPVAGLAIHVRC